MLFKVCFEVLTKFGNLDNLWLPGFNEMSIN